MKSNNINKIIVTTNEWYTNEKFERNGIQEIKKAGYDVELWNEGLFCYEHVPNIPDDLYVGDVCVRNFNTREEFRKCLRNLHSDVLLLCYYSDYSDMTSVCEYRINYCNIYGASILCDPWYSNIDYYEKDKE